MLTLEWILAVASMATMVAIGVLGRRRWPDGWAEGLSKKDRRTVLRVVQRGAPLEDPRLRGPADELARTRRAVVDSFEFKLVLTVNGVLTAAFFTAATSLIAAGRHTVGLFLAHLVGGVFFGVALSVSLWVTARRRARSAWRLNAAE